VPTRAARPYQGRADADPKGIVPGAGPGPACACACFKGRPDAATRAIRRTKAEPQPCAAAKLPSLDSNQNLLVQSQALLPVELEGME
jgi:hypothetical protein